MYKVINRLLNLLIISISCLSFQACQPTKLMVARYDPTGSRQLNNDNQTGLLYYLPKKYLRFQVQCKVYRQIEIREYKTKLIDYRILNEVGFIQNVSLTEQILADEKEPIFLKLNRPSSSSNSLNATVNINDVGLLSSINTESEGKAGEIFNGIAETTASLIRMGSSLLAPNIDIKGRGNENEEVPPIVKIAVDTINQTFNRLVEINQAGDINISLREFIPSLNTRSRIQVRVMIDSSQITKTENPLKSTTNYIEGVLYRIGIPARTRVEISNPDEVGFIRDKPLNREVVFDDYIIYPQFGGYAIASLAISGGGKQITNVSFNASGALKTYTIDKKTNNIERNQQRQATLQSLENTTLDVKYNSRSKASLKRKEARDAQIAEMEAEIEQENKRQQLEEQLLDLQEKKKALEEKKKSKKD